jgi:predicted transcriptional regulator
VPKNLDIITADYPDLREHILTHATRIATFEETEPTPPPITIRQGRGYRIDPDLSHRIKIMAAELGTDSSTLVEQAIREYLANHEQVAHDAWEAQWQDFLARQEATRRA